MSQLSQLSQTTSLRTIKTVLSHQRQCLNHDICLNCLIAGTTSFILIHYPTLSEKFLTRWIEVASDRLPCKRMNLTPSRMHNLGCFGRNVLYSSQDSSDRLVWN